MSLYLSDIRDEIKKTLERRKEQILDRSNSSNWFYKRSNWVRMTSLAKIGIDSEIRRKWVLFGGMLNSEQQLASGFSDMYNLSDDYYTMMSTEENKFSSGMSAGNEANDSFETLVDFGNNVTDQMINVPIPGITNLSIQNKGSMGSTREASVSFSCHDMKQLNMLELLYMTPGVSILLEWGWSVDMDGEPININLGAQEPMFDHCANKKIQKHIKDTGGNYDGMQGVITNFSWEFNDQGGADCQITIVSMAETYLSMDTHNSSKNIPKTDVETNDDESTRPSSIEENLMSSIWKAYDILDKEDKIEINNVYQGVKLDKIDTDKKYKEDTDWWNEDIVDNEDLNYYVSWEYIERYIINANLSYINDKPEQKYDKECLEDLKSTNQANKPIFPVFDSYGVLINYHKNIASSDPTICMLPKPKFDSIDGYLNETDRYIQRFHILAGYNWEEKPFEDDKLKLNRILVNLKFVYETYKQTDKLNDFVLNLLNGISEACGGIWKFNLQIDEEESHKIKIVENNTTFKETQKDPFVVPTFAINSLARDVGFSTELDSDMKTQMMYGSNSSNKGNSQKSNSKNFKLQGYNFFGKKVTNLAVGEIRTLEPNELGETDNVNDKKVTKDFDEKDYLRELFESYDNIYFGKITPENTEAAKTALNKYVTECILDDETQKPKSHFEHVILPVSMTLTLDGISGILFGNMIDISYKPERYNQNVYFQITNVSHDIDSSGDWTTSLETIMRVDSAKLVESRKIKQKSTNKSEIYMPSNEYPGQDFIPDRSDSDATWDRQTNIEIQTLHPRIRQDVINFINEAEQSGFYLRLVTGSRTFDKQQILYDKGRKTSGEIVTNAKPGESYHNYALAVDVVEVDPEYGYEENYSDDRWKTISRIGKKQGFEWGGDFSSIIDKPHFQKTLGYTIDHLLEKHKNNEYDKNGYLEL